MRRERDEQRGWFFGLPVHPVITGKWCIFGGPPPKLGVFKNNPKLGVLKADRPKLGVF